MNSPAEKLSDAARKLLQLDRQPAWRPGMFDELARELREHSDQHWHQLAQHEQNALERARYLVDCAARLTGPELSFILCELYTPQQRAYTLGRLAAHPDASMAMVLATMESPEVTR